MLPRLKHPIYTFTVPTLQKELKFRPFLLKEEKLLLMAKASKNRSDILLAIQQVVSNCMLDKGYDIGLFPLVDLEWLFLKLRAVSVNNVVKVAYKDNEDNKDYEFEIDLNEVKVEFPDNSISKTIPVSETISIVMKYPEASVYGDERFTNTEDLEFFVMKTLEQIIEGETTHLVSLESEEELKAFIETIPSQAFEKIQQFWANLPHLKYEIKYTNSLGSERTIPLTSLEDFFTF